MERNFVTSTLTFTAETDQIGIFPLINTQMEMYIHVVFFCHFSLNLVENFIISAWKLLLVWNGSELDTL